MTTSDDNVRFVSHSEFNAYRRCRRSWFVHYVLKRAQPPAEPGALDLGRITHEGLEVITNNGTLSEAKQRILAVAKEDAETAEMTRITLGLPNIPLSEQWMEAAGDAQNYIEGYVQWLEDTGADQRYVTYAAEEEMQMPLVTGRTTGRQWILRGKLDRRMRDRATGRLTYMDYKTCATFESVMDRAYISEQFPCYEALLEYNHPDEQCSAGVWRMLRKVKRARNAEGEFFRDHSVSINAKHVNAVITRFGIMALEMDLLEHMWFEFGDTDVFYPTPNDSCRWQCPIKHECPMFDDGSRVFDMLDVQFVEINPYARYGELEGE